MKFSQTFVVLNLCLKLVASCAPTKIPVTTTTSTTPQTTTTPSPCSFQITEGAVSGNQVSCQGDTCVLPSGAVALLTVDCPSGEVSVNNAECSQLGTGSQMSVCCNNGVLSAAHSIALNSSLVDTTSLSSITCQDCEDFCQMLNEISLDEFFGTTARDLCTNFGFHITMINDYVVNCNIPSGRMFTLDNTDCTVYLRVGTNDEVSDLGTELPVGSPISFSCTDGALLTNRNFGGSLGNDIIPANSDVFWFYCISQ